MKTQRERNEDAVWRATHNDYRGMIDGQRTIMVLRGGGSCLVTLGGLTDEEIAARLPKKA